MQRELLKSVNLTAQDGNGHYAFQFLEDAPLGVGRLIPGSFSEIQVVTPNGGTPMVLKGLLPCVLGPLSLEERVPLAYELNTRTERFHELLRERGIRLPEPYVTEVTKHGWAVHSAPYLGEDYCFLIQNDPGLARELIRGVMRCIASFIAQNPPYEIGMDLRLTNFAGPQTETAYVDTFPPLFRDGDLVHVHIPQPETAGEVESHIRRKFDPRGSLRRLRFDLMAIDPELEGVFLSELQDVAAAGRYAEILNFFEGLPDHGITPRTTLLEVVRRAESMDPQDIDGFRDVGARWIPSGPQRRQVMERLFRIVRSPIIGDTMVVPPEDRIKAFISFLMEQ